MVLINAILSNLSIFYFSFYKTSKAIINELIKIQRGFLWGGVEENKKIDWISWEKICLSKKKGGTQY